MEILLSSSHRYPAFRAESAGKSPTPYPSGSAYMTHDLLARGLAELGNEVFYFPRGGADQDTPDGVTVVEQPKQDADLHHMLIDSDEKAFWEQHTWNNPRVVSCHIDPRLIGKDWGEITEQWIFVSRSLAESLGKLRYVWNGIDPDEYVFSSVKQDYHLFMAPMDWADRKGLDVAIDLARTAGFRLIVAGGSSDPEVIQRIADRCAEYPNVDYVGDVRGGYKAELLAGARSLIFPTKVNEAFGLVIVEALISGTPVVCSGKGACAELVTPEVGFVCEGKGEYLQALSRVMEISPEVCRAKAITDFHYLRMAERFLKEYQREIERS